MAAEALHHGWARLSRVQERLLWQQQAQLLMGALQHTEAAAFYKTLLISGAAVECAPMVAEGTCMSNLLVKGVMASGNLCTHIGRPEHGPLQNQINNEGGIAVQQRV